MNRALLGDRSAPVWGPAHLVDLLVVRRLRERPPRPQPERVVEGRRLDVRFQLAMEVLRGRSRRKGDHRPPTDRVLLGRALGHVELPGQRPALSQEIPNVLPGGGGQGAVRVELHAQFDGGAIGQDGRPGCPARVTAYSPLPLEGPPQPVFPGPLSLSRGDLPLRFKGSVGRTERMVPTGRATGSRQSRGLRFGVPPLPAETGSDLPPRLPLEIDDASPVHRVRAGEGRGGALLQAYQEEPAVLLESGQSLRLVDPEVREQPRAFHPGAELRGVDLTGPFALQSPGTGRAGPGRGPWCRRAIERSSRRGASSLASSRRGAKSPLCGVPSPCGPSGPFTAGGDPGPGGSTPRSGESREGGSPPP